MSDHDRDTDSARPTKRARLASPSTLPSGSTPRIAPAAPQSSTPSAPSASASQPIDADLEREIRAGITEYVCPHNAGFQGTLKQRYTDFLVNEIGLDGEVVHLWSTRVERNGHGKKGEKNREREREANGKVSSEQDAGEVTTIKIEGEGKEEVLVKKGEEMVSAEAKKDTEQGAENGEDPAVKEEPEEQLSGEDRSTLDSIFGAETTEKILILVRQVRTRAHKKAKEFKPVIAPPITDKDQRTQAHKSLRRIFPNLLESSMEEDQSIRIKATPLAERKGKNKGKGGREREDGRSNRGQQRWEDLGGDYLHFTLYKENKDTMEVVGFLGSKLNCGTKGFGFAGTKDRRACTAQRVCVKRQTAERMYGFNKVLFSAAIGDFEYRPHDLKLGDLKGNEFTITLRDCHFEGETDSAVTSRLDLANKVIGKAIQDFSSKGFINYYGLQRFGSFAASTDAIGRKMLQDDLQGAVADLLTYSSTALAAATNTGDPTLLVSQDDRNRAQALHIWATEGKGLAALDLLPRKFTAERNIIQHLSSRNGKNGRYDRHSDWQGALMTIPRNLRLMYVHAYQSLVWNVVAGKRWTTHGDTVVAGDLVLVNEHRDKETSTRQEAKDDEDQHGEQIINPSGSEDANAASADFERARPLTAAEAASGQYTIWDVVLPQPGFDVEYPKNSIGEFYKEFMGSERGGGLDPHNMRRPWREVSLSGGYRKFLAKPLKEVQFWVHEYQKEDEQFVETDLHRVREKEGQVGANGSGAGGKKQEENGDVKMENDDTDGQAEERIAVVLRLQLASSQYATIALRELMKAGGVKAYKPEFMGGR